MRIFFAVFLGKTIIWVVRKLGKGGGSALPGLIALKIDPNFVNKITTRLPQGVVVVTGTNGKTTTSKYILNILKGSGLKVIANQTGSNLSRGIASALIENCSITGKPRGDIGLFEVDEATMPEAAQSLRPRYVVVTNLFRDQLDRYGELDKTASIIAGSLEFLGGSTIILNADDPLVASLSRFAPQDAKVFYFGLNEDNYLARSKASFDSKDCILCGKELVFKKRYFAHLGDYYCPKCNFKRPALHFAASGIELFGLKKANVKFSSKEGEAFAGLKLSGLYNIYNALAAYSFGKVLGISDQVIVLALENVSAAFGRMERLNIKGKEAYLLLIKNPIGFSQVVETISTDAEAKSFLLCLNDNFADGTDISWIWDADLEVLPRDFRSIITAGIRAQDMALRLKYADLDMKKIATVEEVIPALNKALEKLESGETLYILPTYTAMLEIRNYLTKEGAAAGFWEEA